MGPSRPAPAYIPLIMPPQPVAPIPVQLPNLPILGPLNPIIIAPLDYAPAPAEMNLLQEDYPQMGAPAEDGDNDVPALDDDLAFDPYNDYYYNN